jgi:GTPase-associated protein 1, N-terminal domain type 1
MVDGFEEYLSGYPVPGEETYAVVKTWYAPEMERPGCVWSHALILQNSDVGKVQDLRNLVALFRRPLYGNADYLDYYQRPAAACPSVIRHTVPDSSISDAAAVLAALYGKEEKPVVIPSPDSQAFEPLMLQVWSQQWPALRVAFRFCTGSLSSRTFAGQTFDLQVIPQKLVGELRRNPTAYIFQSIPAVEEQSHLARWVRAGATDLTGQVRTFRSFAWRYADPCGGQRSLYSKLGELFLYLEDLGARLSESALPDVAHRVSELYPDATCGTALKQELFGDASKSGLIAYDIIEETRLIVVARTSDWRSFDAMDLSLRERGRKFWKNEQGRNKTFLLELLDSPTNPLGEEVIAGCVEAIAISEACEIAKERNGLLLALITRNPRLVLSKEFWRCPIPVHTYYSVLDFLATSRESALPASEWLPCLLDSGGDELASSVAERFPTEVIKTFLDRELGAGTVQGPASPSWRDALAKHQVELLSSLESDEYRNSSHAMALLAGLLDPHQARILHYGLSSWVKLAKEAADVVLAFPSGEASSFLLSLGFQYPEADTVILVATCFEHVHAAARDDAHDPLSYRAWKSLEPEVPVLNYTWNWDKCERLRRALVERFIKKSWPRDQFLQCVNRPGTLLSVFYSCREVRGGEDFIRGIAAEVLSGVLRTTEAQASMFQSSFRWTRRGVLKMDL